MKLLSSARQYNALVLEFLFLFFLEIRQIYIYLASASTQALLQVFPPSQ